MTALLTSFDVMLYWNSPPPPQFFKSTFHLAHLTRSVGLWSALPPSGQYERQHEERVEWSDMCWCVSLFLSPPLCVWLGCSVEHPQLSLFFLFQCELLPTNDPVTNKLFLPLYLSSCFPSSFFFPLPVHRCVFPAAPLLRSLSPLPHLSLIMLSPPHTRSWRRLAGIRWVTSMRPLNTFKLSVPSESWD